MKILLLIFALTCFFFQNTLHAQEEDFEFFLIDNYVNPDNHDQFILSFFTSENARTYIVLEDRYEIEVSDTLTDNHRLETDISDLDFSRKTVPFFMVAVDSAGKQHYSDRYEFDLPYEVKVDGGSGMLTFCLFGGVVFALPSPAYVRMKEENYFSLTKEIPLVFLRADGLGYPAGYFSAEYSHIFNAPVKNFLRLGYKHIIDIPGIEYISPGINGFTNFKGFNGISPEISFGLFRLYNVFTLYTRYRFNVKPGETGSEFHEISLGLYSGFFAIYL
jgi:hypothetical protein